MRHIPETEEHLHSDTVTPLNSASVSPTRTRPEKALSKS